MPDLSGASVDGQEALAAAAWVGGNDASEARVSEVVRRGGTRERVRKKIDTLIKGPDHAGQYELDCRLDDMPGRL